MPSLPALALLIASQAARAGEPVLVAGFQPASPESAGLAALLSMALEEALAGEPEVEVLACDQVRPIGDADARLYLETCPRGEQVGCAYVVAEHAGAAYAVTGSLDVGEEYSAVRLSLVDVGEAREAVGLDLVLVQGEDQAFMTAVADLLGRLVRGEIGGLTDIREGAAAPPGRPLDESEVQAVLAEAGGRVPVAGLRTGLAVALPSFGPGDLERLRQEEGLTEWERLGMSERAYLAWRNSGLDLASWRRAQAGRALQVLVRAWGGALFGPVEGRYHARFALDLLEDDPVVETYAWQAATGALAGAWGLDLGFGLTPSVEVEVGVARVHGRFHTLVQQEEVGEPVLPEDEILTGNASTALTAGLRLAPFPTRALRPVVGAGVLFWRGSAVGDHVDLSTLQVALPEFAPPRLLGARALGGVELRLGPRWDLVGEVPLALLVGDFWAEHDEGGTALADKEPRPGPAPVCAGLTIGVQARLGGRIPRSLRGGQAEDEGALDELD